MAVGVESSCEWAGSEFVTVGVQLCTHMAWVAAEASVIASFDAAGWSCWWGAHLLTRSVRLVRYWRLRELLLFNISESRGQVTGLLWGRHVWPATVVAVLLSMVGLLGVLLTSIGMARLVSS
jgi:hypothetical protein